MTTTRTLASALALLLAALAAVVSAADGDAAATGDADAARDPAWKRGRALFHDTQELFYPSCAHCHSLLPAEEERERAEHLGPGATLYGSALRRGWRNRDSYDDVAEASEPCAKDWQERRGGLTADQRADLLAFLSTFVPDEGGPLPMREIEKKPQPLEDWTGGDAARGEKWTLRYCGGCHHGGEDAVSFDLRPGRKRSDLIARKVRGYDTRGRFDPDEGTMAWYPTDRLSDGQLRDIIAHLGR